MKPFFSRKPVLYTSVNVNRAGLPLFITEVVNSSWVKNATTITAIISFLLIWQKSFTNKTVKNWVKEIFFKSNSSPLSSKAIL